MKLEANVIVNILNALSIILICQSFAYLLQTHLVFFKCSLYHKRKTDFLQQIHLHFYPQCRLLGNWKTYWWVLIRKSSTLEGRLKSVDLPQAFEMTKPCDLYKSCNLLSHSFLFCKMENLLTQLFIKIKRDYHCSQLCHTPWWAMNMSNVVHHLFQNRVIKLFRSKSRDLISVVSLSKVGDLQV